MIVLSGLNMIVEAFVAPNAYIEKMR